MFDTLVVIEVSFGKVLILLALLIGFDLWYTKRLERKARKEGFEESKQITRASLRDVSKWCGCGQYNDKVDAVLAYLDECYERGTLPDGHWCREFIKNYQHRKRG